MYILSVCKRIGGVDLTPPLLIENKILIEALVDVTLTL